MFTREVTSTSSVNWKQDNFSTNLHPNSIELTVQSIPTQGVALPLSNREISVLSPIPRLSWNEELIEQAKRSPNNLVCVDWKIDFTMPKHLEYPSGVCVYFLVRDHTEYLYIGPEHPLKQIADLFCVIKSEICQGQVSNETFALCTRAIRSFRKALPQLPVSNLDFIEIKQVCEILASILGEAFVKHDSCSGSDNSHVLTMDEFVRLAHAIYNLHKNKYNFDPSIDKLKLLINLNYVMRNAYEYKISYEMRNYNPFEIQKISSDLNSISDITTIDHQKNLCSLYLNYFYAHNEYINDVKLFIISSIKCFMEHCNQDDLNSLIDLNFPLKNIEKDFGFENIICKPLDNFPIYWVRDFAIGLFKIALIENYVEMFDLYELATILIEIQKSMLRNNSPSQIKFLDLLAKEHRIAFDECNKKCQEREIALGEKLSSVLNSNLESLQIKLDIDYCEIKLSCESSNQTEALLNALSKAGIEPELVDEKIIVKFSRNIILNPESFIESFKEAKFYLPYFLHRDSYIKTLTNKYKKQFFDRKITFASSYSSVSLNLEQMPKWLRAKFFEDSRVMALNLSSGKLSVTVPISPENLQTTKGESIEVLDIILKALNDCSQTPVKSSKRPTKKPQQKTQRLTNYYPQQGIKEPRNPASIKKGEEVKKEAPIVKQTLTEPESRVIWQWKDYVYDEANPALVKKLATPFDVPIDAHYGFIDPNIELGTQRKAFERVLAEGKYKTHGMGLKSVKRSEAKKHGLDSSYFVKLKIPKSDSRLYGKIIDQIEDTAGHKKILIHFDNLKSKTH